MKTELYLKEQYDVYRIKINENVLCIRQNKFNQDVINLKNYKLGQQFIRSYITLHQVSNHIPKVKPILRANAPKLEFMTNTPTEYNKLSGLEEILNLTKCKKKGAKTMNKITRNIVSIMYRYGFI